MAGGFNLAEVLRDSVSNLNTPSGEIISIDLDRIEEDSRNFYSIDSAELEALAGNIELVGQLDPVVVRKNAEKPGSYILLSGHRRCRALRMLRDEGKEQFKTVKAIVREADSSPEFEELVLIFANSNTRKMSSADLNKQAERVTELLYELKEQGVNFPGRMRDHVAEVCQIHKSKLARLQAIRNNLTFPGWKEYYEAGKLGESIAYEISKLGYKNQSEFWDWLIDNDTAPIHATLADLKEFEYVSACYCVETQSRCYVAELIYENTLCGKQCAGCCKSCLKKDTCTTARICPCLKDHFAELDKKAAEKAAEPEHENEGTKRMSIAETFGKRLTHCRMAAGYDRKAFAINQGYNPATYSAWETAASPPLTTSCSSRRRLTRQRTFYLEPATTRQRCLIRTQARGGEMCCQMRAATISASTDGTPRSSTSMLKSRSGETIRKAATRLTMSGHGWKFPRRMSK